MIVRGEDVHGVPMSQEPRRGLAAVMFADMVGFTALMGEDEAAARAARDRQREVVARLVARHGGDVRQYYGDGTLATFPSAVEAAKCAVAIQRELVEPPVVPLRIGLHVGDIADEGDGIYGDGVNVAARIEGLAPSGGVVVSDKMFDEIKNHRDLTARSLGVVRLKNVRRPIEAFALISEGLTVPDKLPASKPGRFSGAKLRSAVGVVGVAAALGLLWVSTRPTAGARGTGARDGEPIPSIAVIPFRNLSADRENAAFFSDGLHDDILTQLAKIGSLSVIARTSVMRFAGTQAPVTEIGRTLGVATVLEGGVQRAGDRIRLNVQLIDSETDAHLWAQTYDRELTAENVFAIQSELAKDIASALHTVLTGDERRALDEVPTASLAAYDHYLRAAAVMRETTGSYELNDALASLQEAVRLDPGFAMAHARLAYVHLDYYWNAFDRTDARLEMAGRALARAQALAPANPEVQVAQGYYHYYGFREYEAALAAFDAALSSRPGDARLYEARAYVLRRMGRWSDAVGELERATRLDPLNAEMVRALGQMHMQWGHYDEAERYSRRALVVDPDRWSPRYDLALTGLLRDGDLSGIEELADGLASNYVLRFVRWWYPYLAGDEAQAFAATSSFDGPISQQTSVHTVSLMNALVHWTHGRTAEARTAADSALDELSDPIYAPDDPRVQAARGTVLALLGLHDRALAAGREAVRLLPVEADALDGPEYLLHLARIHTILGEEDAAVEVLGELLSRPSGNSLTSILVDPTFAPLRDHPGIAPLRRGVAAP